MEIKDIKDPNFLKLLKIKELKTLSKEIRDEIISNVSKCGGHLSSNLGIVELTIALYKNFNPPKDKIIFDVGHQCYTQKILTGRLDKFNTLRQYNGLSGFQKKKESIYDCYEAGHSSTSISAALGFAYARDLNHEKNEVIAVIGDGSIGNGLAYEALNHIGEIKTKVIVILNDNEMSISENIGAIHNYLDKIRTGQEYHNAKRRTKNILDKIPLIGKPIKNFTSNIKDSIKSVYLKDGYFFEELGFKYYGPINGHDFKELNQYMKLAKEEDGPILLHVITEKGKGYLPAEKDKVGAWHGVSPFDKDKGILTDKSIWSDVITGHLLELAKKNKDLLVITPAMAGGSKLIPFKKKYPKRFIDCGIAEEHALVLANGLSQEKKIPFVSIYSTFLQRGYDEVLHDIARMNSHVIIGIDRAGIVGSDGETHQGIYDISFLLPIPNLIITSPKDNLEAGNLLYTATITNKPFCIRYSKNSIDYEKIKYKRIKIGSWEILKDGVDAYIITYGDFINNALEISKINNYNIGVINARFIKPIDEDLFNKINVPIFVYEEVCGIGSLGSYLRSISNKEIICYNIPDKFIPQGDRNLILKDLNLDILSINNKINNYLKKKEN